MIMDLGICCYKTCKKDATTKGFIYGHFKEDNDKKDRFINLATCDEHAKEKDFYPEDNHEKHRENTDKIGDKKGEF